MTNCTNVTERSNLSTFTSTETTTSPDEERLQIILIFFQTSPNRENRLFRQVVEQHTRRRRRRTGEFHGKSQSSGRHSRAKAVRARTSPSCTEVNYRGDGFISGRSRARNDTGLKRDTKTRSWSESSHDREGGKDEKSRGVFLSTAFPLCSLSDHSRKRWAKSCVVCRFLVTREPRQATKTLLIVTSAGEQCFSVSRGFKLKLNFKIWDYLKECCWDTVITPLWHDLRPRASSNNTI